MVHNKISQILNSAGISANQFNELKEKAVSFGKTEKELLKCLEFVGTLKTKPNYNLVIELLKK